MHCSHYYFKLSVIFRKIKNKKNIDILLEVLEHMNAMVPLKCSFYHSGYSKGETERPAGRLLL